VVNADRGPLLTDTAFVVGARALLADYARLKADDAVLFVHDRSVAAVCRGVASVATCTGIAVTELPATAEWTRIATKLNDGYAAVLFLESGESHHTQALLHHLSTAPDPPRAYRLFGATPETLRQGFRRRQSTLRRRNWDLIEHARRAGRLSVQSECGTRLTVGLDRSASWTSTCGEFADGFPGILPPAEVNTRSADVDGIVVVDGAIGSNIGWPLDVRLVTNP
jgi:hypothetical protein